MSRQRVPPRVSYCVSIPDEMENIHMKDFAFYLTPEEIVYYGAIIRNLPYEFLDIHIGPTQKTISSFLPLHKETQRHIETLADEGYSVFPLNANLLRHYRNVVLSSGFFGRLQTHFDWQTGRRMGLACLFHSTDTPGRSNQFPASWYILAHQRQAQSPEKNKISRRENEALFAQLMTLPREMLNEYAYTGLYHLGEWTEKRHSPKDCLRAELEERLQSSLPAHRPVVAFLQDEFCHPRQVTQALEKLTPYVTLIIKGNLPEPVTGAYTWPEANYAPNLLRFAADFLLAGYHSGTLASSTMLGLPVVPYYTNLIHKGGRVFGKLDKYTAYLPGYFKDQHVCVDILEQLNPPVNLMDTQAVLERVHDAAWWVTYAQRLPTAQKIIFGDYEIDGAAAKTARLLVRIFGRGSFGEDAVAVRLRPEYGELVRFLHPCQHLYE